MHCTRIALLKYEDHLYRGKVTQSPPGTPPSGDPLCAPECKRAHVSREFLAVAPEHVRATMPVEMLLQVAQCDSSSSSPSSPSACPMSPVCAVLGGFLAQEVVKAVAANAAPFQSMLIFNALLGDARVFPA